MTETRSNSRGSFARRMSYAFFTFAALLIVVNLVTGNEIPVAAIGVLIIGVILLIVGKTAQGR